MDRSRPILAEIAGRVRFAPIGAARIDSAEIGDRVRKDAAMESRDIGHCRGAATRNGEEERGRAANSADMSHLHRIGFDEQRLSGGGENANPPLFITAGRPRLIRAGFQNRLVVAINDAGRPILVAAVADGGRRRMRRGQRPRLQATGPTVAARRV